MESQNEEAQTEETQNGADKPRDVKSYLLIGAFAVVAVVVIIMVVLMPPKPEPGPDDQSNNDVTSVVARTLPTRSGSEDKQVPVIVPVRAQGLDGGGSRVPLRVRGTEHTGEAVDEVAYAEADGSGISLYKGTYQVTAEGSPIAGDGTIYYVPDATIEIVLDDKAVEEGYTAPTDQAITFEPMDAADVTEELIVAAVSLCQADPGRSAQAEGLAQAARTRRDVALDPANFTEHFSTFDFVVPKAWRKKVSFAENEYEQWLEWEGWRMICQAGENASFLAHEGDSSRTVTLDNGGRLTMIPWSDSTMGANLTSPDGAMATFWISVPDQYLGSFWNRSDEECARFKEMLAAITNLSPQDDSREIAFAAAQALAEGITVTRGTDPADYLASHDRYDLILPGPWRGKLNMS
ncbi:MAG: hypothetical protein Q4B54_14135, partial [Coriobacteriales bacterium]|nr:hypothetical protein [Coriobacteriales bacterium]